MDLPGFIYRKNYLLVPPRISQASVDTDTRRTHTTQQQLISDSVTDSRLLRKGRINQLYHSSNETRRNIDSELPRRIRNESISTASGYCRLSHSVP